MASLIKIVRCVIFCCLITAYNQSIAAETIDFLISNNQQSRFISESVKQDLQSTKPDLTIRSISGEQLAIYRADENTTLTVSIGTKATSYLFSKNLKTPVYSLMVPEIAYQSILKKSSTTTKSSALYLDQPLIRYFELINKLIPSEKTVGIFSNNQLSGKHKTYKRLALKYNIKLEIKEIKILADPLSEINQLFMQTDIVLLIPDKIINPLMTKWILFSAYKHKKPVIGFSKQLLEAGALASIHTDLEELSSEATNELIQFLETGVFDREPHYPNSYEIKFNSAIADYLNINTDNIILK